MIMIMINYMRNKLLVLVLVTEKKKKIKAGFLI